MQGKLTAYIRVSTIWKEGDRFFLNGKIVRRESLQLATVISYVVVNVHVDCLHTEPKKGDYWEVCGTVEYRTETYSNNYERTRIYFENPSRFKLTMPNDIEEMMTFIADSKEFYRIGRKTLLDAQEVLCEELFPSLINKDLAKLRTAFTDKQIETLLNGFERFENLRHSIWLSQHHIPPYIQQKLFKLNKSFDPRDIKNNPYELITLGLSFEQADKIAKESFGFTESHPYRLIGATNDALKAISKWGSTWATAGQVLPLVRKRLKLNVNESDLAEIAMSLAVRKFCFTEINGRFHHGTYLFMEKVITHRFKNMLSTKAEWTDLHPEVINKAMADNLFSLTEKQAEAVFKALEYNLATIIGGAGTGKTTVLRTVLRAFHELGYNIHAVALAGKAAMTLKKSVGFRTSTIARFLGQKPLVEGKNVVIIDEASMVDLPTMFQIVLHCSPDVRFILVGDDNQLASIRAGLILTDIVRSGVIPVTELDIVQRQEGSTGIPDYSTLIKDGIVPSNLTTGNIHFLECLPTRFIDACASLYAEDPLNSQIIVATNDTKDAINKYCQATFNGAAEPLIIDMGYREFGTKFRKGDPVIFTKNNYEADIQNGSLGKLISVTPNEKKGSFGEVVLDGGRKVLLTQELLAKLDLAYAITLHKGQGSQFKRVIVVVENSGLVDRSWVYTGITRTEVELHLLGAEHKLINAITGLSAKYKRQTYLADLLKKHIKPLA